MASSVVLPYPSAAVSFAPIAAISLCLGVMALLGSYRSVTAWPTASHPATRLRLLRESHRPRGRLLCSGLAKLSGAASLNLCPASSR